MDNRKLYIKFYLPLYLQLKNTLLNRIDNGELLPGERLESERDLAEKYGVNRQTVRSALNVLIEDGVLIKGVVTNSH